MDRFFRFVVRQKRKSADRWEEHPWRMLVLEVVGGLLNKSLPVYLKDQKIKALQDEVRRLQFQVVTRRQPSASELRSGFTPRF